MKLINSLDMFLRKSLLPLGILLFMLPVACNKGESDLGVDLQDPYTFYNGVRDTVTLTAGTIFDDSLWTAGYDFGVIGDYQDEVFGEARATLYSQIGISSENGISLDNEVVFDSVVMTLVIDTVYPVVPDSTPVTFHLIVKQLAEPLRDSVYHATLSSHSLLEDDVCFFDGDVVYKADSIRVRMNESIYPVLRQNCTTEEFLERVKGMSLKLAEYSNKMMTIDLSATNTRLTLYYHTENVESLQYVFVINKEVGHSMYFQHDYTGKAIEAIANHTVDSIAGGQRLYLEPLGGTRVRLNMQSFINRFRKEHPWAVVHYAELLLPVSSEGDTHKPVRILANKCFSNSPSVMITDANVLSNPYTYTGYDGYFHREEGYYRLRITRHLQELLRAGRDYGTELYIDARRSTPFRTVIKGTDTDDPVRVVFIYSEHTTQ